MAVTLLVKGYEGRLKKTSWKGLIALASQSIPSWNRVVECYIAKVFVTTHIFMLGERGIYRLAHGRQFVASKPLQVALAMVLLAGLAQGASAQAPPQAFQKLMQPYVDARMFMGSVLVASKGKTIFSNSYGMADLEWSISNSPATRFNIASMTKQFTAAAILLLEDRGKLKTSDPVKKYLPDAPASWDNITIYHLLTHTSGI